MSATEEQLRELYTQAKTIAVVGCSPHWPNPPAVVPEYMQSEGYRILPVNPHEDEVLGEPAVDSLDDLTEQVDIVDVFRPAEEAPGIAAQAVRIGAGCLWLQTGIVSDEAEQIAREAGLLTVMDLCIGITYGELGLGVGVKAWKAARLAGDP
jgi:predicted CoA-binding protein